MARERRHPPSAACLSASMRDLGYSLETAIADLIDNSISAGADTIDTICDVSGEHPILVILDNGKGMTEVELLAAMRHGTWTASMPPTTGYCPYWTMRTSIVCPMSSNSAAKVQPSSGGSSID